MTINQAVWEIHRQIHAEVDPILRPPDIYEAEYKTTQQVNDRKRYLTKKRASQKYRASLKGRVLDWLRRNQTAIPYATWREHEAQKLGLTQHGIKDRVERGHYPELRIKRFNNRYTFCWFSANTRPKL